MREDFDGYEIVTVQEDKSRWWQNRKITFDWRTFLIIAAIAGVGLLRELLALQPQ